MAIDSASSNTYCCGIRKLCVVCGCCNKQSVTRSGITA